MKKFDVGFVPKDNVSGGLLVRVEKPPEWCWPFLVGDLRKGQRFYDSPKGQGKILGVYVKAPLT